MNSCGFFINLSVPSVHFIYDFYTFIWHYDLLADVKVQITWIKFDFLLWWNVFNWQRQRECFTVVCELNQEMEEFFSV